MFEEKRCEQVAQSLLGMTYKLGGRGPKEIDCYGVLVKFYEHFGIRLPDYSYVEDWNDQEEYYLKEYASFFRKLGPDEKPEPGDMILFRATPETANHAGIYIGAGKFIHSYQKIGVKIDHLRNRFWKKRVYGFFRKK